MMKKWAAAALAAALTAAVSPPPGGAETPGSGGHAHNCGEYPHDPDFAAGVWYGGDHWTTVQQLEVCLQDRTAAWEGATPARPSSGPLWDSLEIAKARLQAAREWASYNVPASEASVFIAWVNGGEGWGVGNTAWVALEAELSRRRAEREAAEEAVRAAEEAARAAVIAAEREERAERKAAARAAEQERLSRLPGSGCGAGHNGVITRTVYFNGFYNVYGASRCL